VAIARTALGTQTATSGTTLTIASISLALGDILVVGSHAKTVSISTVKWNSKSASPRASFGLNLSSSSAVLYDFYCDGPSAATGSIVVTMSGSMSTTNPGSCFAIKVTGCNPYWMGALDQGVAPLSSFGLSGWTYGGNDWSSTTAATSTASGTTAQANELCIGFAGVQGPSTDTAPTALNSFTLGQRAGTNTGTAGNNSTINELYRIVSSTGAYTAACTLGTARAGAACILTYREAVAGANPRSTLLGVG
jgi:hypothetical protein